MTKNRRLANAIRKWLLDHDMWQDVTIYFDGKAYNTRDPENGKFYYNDPSHLVEYEDDPSFYFDCVNPDNVSMSFEGPVCHMLYYDEYPRLKKSFDKIFERFGVYYEFGDHWNCTCYEKGDNNVSYTNA